VNYGPALFQLYRQAGAAVFPSTTEGLPQVINEALSVGLPTIATKVGGIPGFLKDETEALLVPPSDVLALADAIERLVKNDGLRSRLRASGRSLMAQHTLEANRSIVMKVIRNANVARSA
jgi:glycosyltransferase involved in cell wall biosynthesis